MVSAADTLQMQRDQYQHDHRNHSDIAQLHKIQRLMHYGLHYCKYVGRFARGAEEAKSIVDTITDIALVSLSAANTMSQHLSDYDEVKTTSKHFRELIFELADASGRYADACEKYDHFEDGPAQARAANLDIFWWCVKASTACQHDLANSIKARRSVLSKRAFYIAPQG